jgi:hypothetical protein
VPDPDRLDGVEDLLVDPARGEQRDRVAVAREDGAAPTPVERHQDLQRPFGEDPGVIGADDEVREPVDQVYVTLHGPTSSAPMVAATRVPGQ